MLERLAGEVPRHDLALTNGRSGAELPMSRQIRRRRPLPSYRRGGTACSRRSLPGRPGRGRSGGNPTTFRPHHPTTNDHPMRAPRIVPRSPRSRTEIPPGRPANRACPVRARSSRRTPPPRPYCAGPAAAVTPTSTRRRGGPGGSARLREDAVPLEYRMPCSSAIDRRCRTA